MKPMDLQKAQNQNDKISLLKNCVNDLTTISSEIIQKPPIVQLIQSGLKTDVEDKLLVALTKTCIALGIEINPEQHRLIVQDLIDVFTHEPIETFIEGLKLYRRSGKKYNTINMPEIRPFIEQQIEKLCHEREKINNQHKKDNKEITIDYEALKKRYAKEDEERNGQSERIKKRKEQFMNQFKQITGKDFK
jgi:hypothetical protein